MSERTLVRIQTAIVTIAVLILVIALLSPLGMEV